VVVSTSLRERILDWLAHWREHGWGTTVRKGGLFHELDQRHLPIEVIDEVTEKVKKKTSGYRGE